MVFLLEKEIYRKTLQKWKESGSICLFKKVMQRVSKTNGIYLKGLFLERQFHVEII